MVVNEDGIRVKQGDILTITEEGLLIRAYDIDQHLNIQLDHLGRIEMD